MDALKKYATFSGRATRGQYWSFALINLAIIIVLEIIAQVANVNAILYVAGLYGLAVLVPGLAVLVRRLHDTDRSGGWFFIALVPFIGGLWLLVLTLLGGTAGPNKYGATA